MRGFDVIYMYMAPPITPPRTSSHKGTDQIQQRYGLCLHD